MATKQDNGGTVTAQELELLNACLDKLLERGESRYRQLEPALIRSILAAQSGSPSVEQYQQCPEGERENIPFDFPASRCRLPRVPYSEQGISIGSEKVHESGEAVDSPRRFELA